MPIGVQPTRQITDVFSRRYENGGAVVTSNPPFQLEAATGERVSALEGIGAAEKARSEEKARGGGKERGRGLEALLERPAGTRDEAPDRDRVLTAAE